MTKEPFDLDSHLSRIETRWSVVDRAHDDGATAREAQTELLARYGAAIKRYLVASLRDDSLADEVFQEFALRFVRGDFERVDKTRGKFRYYVKAVLYNLIRSHFRKQGRRQTVALEGFDPSDSSTVAAAAEDSLFKQNWKDELLARTWKLLGEEETQGRNSYFTVLKSRVSSPAADYEELSATFTRLLGREIAPRNARVIVHRARERFAQLLIESVADTLENPDRCAVESELAELELLTYCKDLLSG